MDATTSKIDDKEMKKFSFSCRRNLLGISSSHERQELVLSSRWDKLSCLPSEPDIIMKYGQKRYLETQKNV